MTSDESSQSVVVRILNTDYNVKCPPDKIEELAEASQLLNDRMSKIREEGKIMSLDRVAIIAALNMASEQIAMRNDLDKERRRNYDLSITLKQRLQQWRNRINNALLDFGED